MSLSCLEVRERLAEFAVDALPAADAREVERHLEWCPGCRKEAEELREGAGRIGLSLRPRTPPSMLELKVADRIAFAAGTKRPAPSRTGFRVAATAALVAAMLAAGSLTWGLAQHNTVKVLRNQVTTTTSKLETLARLIKQVDARDEVLSADLVPPTGGQTGGTAIVVSTPQGADLVMLEVSVPADAPGPFGVLLQQRSGHSIDAGHLVETNNGTYVLVGSPGTPGVRSFPVDLANLGSIVVLDRSSQTILSGPVRPYAG